MSRTPGVQVSAVLLGSSGAVHLGLVGAHSGSPVHAGFFLSAGGGLLLLALLLWCRPTDVVRRFTSISVVGLLALYALSRTMTLPVVGPAEPVDATGLFTKGLEVGVLLALVVDARAHRPGRARAHRPARARAATALAVLLAATAAPLAQAAPAAAATICPDGARALSYAVVAMKVDIVLNNAGDHNPNGLMFALASDEAAIGTQLAANPGKPSPLVRPLVLRANQGDCVNVTLTNKVGRPAGFHVQGLAYDVRTDDGSQTGDNPDSLVPAGGSRSYTYWVPDTEEEGARLIEDLGDPRGGGPLADQGAVAVEGGTAKGSMSQGLYGALNVEPKGSTWTHPVTGADLTGTSEPNADIHLPNAGDDFREFTLIGWDETEVKTAAGLPPREKNGAESSFFGFNYRYEPQRNRVKAPIPESSSTAPDTGDGEELLYSSWAHGDPATPILRGYKGDPAKIRILMAGTKETHVFHLHQHRWRNEPRDPNSTRVDSISWSPGQSFTLDVEGGVGSQTGSAGDSIFHCHLYPHFVAGFWGLLRSHDVLEDGSRHYPDGTVTPALVPLPDRAPPPAPTAEKPGWPHFMPGAVDPSVLDEYPNGRAEQGFGHRPPQTPNGPVKADGTNDRRGPFDTSWRPGGVTDRIAAFSSVEDTSFVSKKPGAPYVDPCTPTARVRAYDITLLQNKIVYNDDGWHDPYGRLYVLSEDVAALKAGTMKPEPLVIRANVGECVTITMRNQLPTSIPASAFQSALTTQEAGIHPHLVKFDLLASDGATNGWNYDQAVLSGQSQRYRWMVDVPIRTAFFHDHAFAGVHQQHGVFGALLQEPQGSTWRDPKTGTTFGTRADGGPTSWRADILDPNGPDQREFSLFVQDLTPLFDSSGKEINPPDVPDDPDDYGVTAVSYRNEPFEFRRTVKKGSTVKAVDAAYVYSSKVHGDPVTPLMEAYRQDPVRLRVFQGSFEEMHTLSLHGARWRHEPDDPTSELRSAQSFGLSEAFNFEAPTFENCGTVACKGDYLYRVNDKDSLWLGAWGLFRVHKFQQDGNSGRAKLVELPDAPRKPPPDSNNIDNDGTQTCGDGLIGGLLGAATCLIDAETGVQDPPDSGKADFCPGTAPVRRYDIVAMQTPLTYNAFGDAEDFGLIYVLAADEAAIRNGTRRPEPLMIRANAGDCIETVLTNKLPTVLPGRTLDDPRFEVDRRRADGTFDWGPSTRVSLHASGLLKYEVNGSDGAVVGKNSNGTVAPGKSITQHWYADREVGPVLLEDLGDQLNHRFRGLFAGLAIEPAGSKYLDPVTGSALASGTQALITDSGGTPRFREFGLFLQDGLTTKAANGTQPMGVEAEAEDGGDKGYNYRSAPFSRRLTNPSSPDPGELAAVFSNRRGCPDTPILQARVGEAVRMRLFGSQDQRRQQSFEVAGHRWPQEPGGTGTVMRNSQDALGPGVQDDLQMTAGGPLRSTGDFRYGSTVYWRHREGGLWGLFRVLPADAAISATPCAGTTPLERPTATAQPAAPTSWTVQKGTIAGSVGALAADDSSYLRLNAVKVGNKFTSDGYGALTLPTSQRDVVGMRVVYDGGATAAGATRTLSLYNAISGTWESVQTIAQPTGELRYAGDMTGDPKRFVSSTGEVRVRVAATGSAAFSLLADQTTVTVTHR